MKYSVYGPGMMGAARALNVMLGSSPIFLTTGLNINNSARIAVVTISLFLFVFAISRLSRKEIDETDKVQYCKRIFCYDFCPSSYYHRVRTCWCVFKRSIRESGIICDNYDNHFHTTTPASAVIFEGYSTDNQNDGTLNYCSGFCFCKRKRRNTIWTSNTNAYNAGYNSVEKVLCYVVGQFNSVCSNM